MNLNEFIEEIRDYPPGNIVFTGLGNEYRGDDGAGLLFVGKLKETAYFNDSVFIKAGTNPENYLRKISDASPALVVFIDAAQTDRTAGDIFWITTEELDSINISTHSFSIKMIEDFLKAENQIDFKYLGIEPKTTGLGLEMSEEVVRGIDRFFD